jgi:hypothetical protein
MLSNIRATMAIVPASSGIKEEPLVVVSKISQLSVVNTMPILKR